MDAAKRWTGRVVLTVGIAGASAAGTGPLSAQAAPAPAPAGASAPASMVRGPLADLAPLIGTWEGRGPGFATRLRYRWILPGAILEAGNEVRNGAGELVGRYHGNYVWDAGREQIVFLTAGAGGEVHRGRAWWRDGILWHEAEVSGGRIDGYASAVRPADGRIEYFADYGVRTADTALLRTEPLIYLEAGSAARYSAAQRPAATLADLRFMTGCWRGDMGNGAALEEMYTAPASNLMLGLSRYLRGNWAVQFEFSRITADSAGVVLLPFPRGTASEHPFRLTSLDRDRATFEAPEHDFPKRIVYIRHADGSLSARIDGGSDDSGAQEWRMQPVPCPAVPNSRSDGGSDSSEAGGNAVLDLDTYKAELSRLSGSGGWWLASNAEHAASDGGIDAYGVRHWIELGGMSAGGCLWSIRDGNAADVIWNFQQGWDGARGAPYYYQTHVSGGTGMGAVTSASEDATVVEQEFWWPDGTRQRTRHTSRWLDRETHETRSATWTAGKWSPGRAYTWKLQPPDQAPCGP
jgi:hypothetical protein